MKYLQPIALVGIAGLALALAPLAPANAWRTLFPHDVDVITVTDMTDAGKAYPHATPAQPVYYKVIDLGKRSFGRVWGGEYTPSNWQALKWLMAALAEQGYRLADEQHPPTQLLVFAWGMRRGDAVQFLGGEKLSWVQSSLKAGIAGKVWDIAGEEVFKIPYLFLGLVHSYTIDSETAPNVTLLWETRFGCEATGLAFDESLPLMIMAAAPNFGRETELPVNVNATDAFKGRVDLGEMKILETDPAMKPAEGTADGTPPPPPTSP